MSSIAITWTRRTGWIGGSEKSVISINRLVGCALPPKTVQFVVGIDSLVAPSAIFGQPSLERFGLLMFGDEFLRSSVIRRPEEDISVSVNIFSYCGPLLSWIQEKQ